MIRFSLPWPPSVNHYYIHTKQGVVLGKRGRDYRMVVKSYLLQHRNSFTDKARLFVTVNLYPPDKRRRDIDNPIKCLLDSLQHAQIFADDNQIDVLNITRRDVIKGGHVSLWISECS